MTTAILETLDSDSYKLVNILHENSVQPASGYLASSFPVVQGAFYEWIITEETTASVVSWSIFIGISSSLLLVIFYELVKLLSAPEYGNF